MRRRNRVRRKEMEARRHHGGEDRSGGIRCDFSVNVNPLGMPECAKKALSENWKIYEEYPDDECGLLRKLWDTGSVSGRNASYAETARRI